jgi:hypothetical protein
MSYEPISQWKVRIGIAVGLIPIAATRVYYVREMLAALIIFSALFALVAAVGLTLFLIWFLLDRARQLEWDGWRSVGRASLAQPYAFCLLAHGSKW